MKLIYRNIHALVLTLAITVALVSFASSSALAQTTLLYEQRSADSQQGDLFEANGAFQIRWTASGGQFLVKLLDQNNIELISSAPQSREESDAPPMTGNMPFAGPGNFKVVIEASGPWHVRIVATDQ